MIALSDFICNVVQNRKIIIALQLRPIATLDYKIGNPTRIEEPGPPTAAPHQGLDETKRQLFTGKLLSHMNQTPEDL